MGEQNAFFRWLYRLLAIGGLLLLLAIAYALIAGQLSSRRWQQRDTVAVQQPTAGGQAKVEVLRFGDLQSIRGSSIQMIGVESEDDRAKRLEFSSGGYGSDFRTRNLVFLQPEGGAAHWLFKDNSQYLGGIDRLCVCAERDQDPVLAIYLEVAVGETDAQRPARVGPALVRIDGTGYTRLGTPVSRVLDKTVGADGKTLGLLVEDQGKLLYRRFSLETFALLSEQLVTQLQRS